MTKCIDVMKVISVRVVGDGTDRWPLNVCGESPSESAESNGRSEDAALLAKYQDCADFSLVLSCYIYLNEHAKGHQYWSIRKSLIGRPTWSTKLEPREAEREGWVARQALTKRSHEPYSGANSNSIA